MSYRKPAPNNSFESDAHYVRAAQVRRYAPQMT